MMRDDTDNILHGFLADWHSHADHQAPETCPTFAGMRSPRGWEREDEIADDSITANRLKAIGDAILSMSPIHRTALQILARNLCTGAQVWSSARLPSDPKERAKLLAESKRLLGAALTKAGVL